MNVWFDKLGAMKDKNPYIIFQVLLPYEFKEMIESNGALYSLAMGHALCRMIPNVKMGQPMRIEFKWGKSCYGLLNVKCQDFPYENLLEAEAKEAIPPECLINGAIVGAISTTELYLSNPSFKATETHPENAKQA